ncbi:MAG: hypothetical protein NTX57_19145 [Armatimonadetes bacterium]|nr:hypothetical protein [Armatimonadota bacterium]
MLITKIEVRSVVTQQKNPGRIPFDVTIAGLLRKHKDDTIF